MKTVRIICAVIGCGGIAAAVLGAGAVEKDLTLGIGVMIAGALALAAAVVIAKLTDAEDEA